MKSRYKDRWETEQEETELEERQAHEDDRCSIWCPYCDKILRDIDDMAEYLDKQANK